MPNLRDYSVAFDAAQRWLNEHQVQVPLGIIQALARVMVDAVDEARARRQQQDGS